MSSIIETVMDGLKSYIVENIDDYLENEERTSDDHLRMPKFVNVYMGDHELSSIDGFPTLMFRYGEISINEETTQQDLYTFNITLWVVLSDSSYENLQRRLFRYTHCLKAIFDSDRSLGGIATESRVANIGYSPVMNANQSMQVAFVDTEIFVLVNRTV